jgi:hypothetical protein
MVALPGFGHGKRKGFAEGGTGSSAEEENDRALWFWPYVKIQRAIENPKTQYRLE